MTKNDFISIIIIGFIFALVFSSLPDSKISWLKQIHPNLKVGEK
jgi:hypothetical protein